MRSLLGRFHRPMSRGAMGDMLTMNSLGDGSTLSLDFTTGVLDSRLTFSRAGGGTYVGTDGYIYGVDNATSASLAIGTGSKSVTITATASVDRRFQVGQNVYFSNGANNMSGLVTAYDSSTQVITINATATTGSGSFTSWFVGNASPRFDYSPTNIGEPRGLLIEGSASNLVTQSNGATSVWGIGGNRTPTNNTTDLLSPDGTNNATKLVCGTATNYASYATTITGLTGGGTYTVSYWIRGPVGHTPRLYALNGTIGDVTPTATTGTYNNTGWTRLTQTYTLPATTTQVYVYFMSVSIVVTGDTFYVYGFQLETGSGASSLIPTGASQVTRNADICYIPISAIGFNTSGGTFFASFYRGEANLDLNQEGSVLNTDYADTRWLSIKSGYGQTTFGLGAWNASINKTGAGVFGLNTAAGSYASWVTSTTGIFTVNGATAVSGTLSNLGITPNNLMIGSASQSSPYNGVSLRDFLNNSIKSIKYFPTAKSAAELQTLTTP